MFSSVWLVDMPSPTLQSLGDLAQRPGLAQGVIDHHPPWWLIFATGTGGNFPFFNYPHQSFMLVDKDALICDISFEKGIFQFGFQAIMTAALSAHMNVNGRLARRSNTNLSGSCIKHHSLWALKQRSSEPSVTHLSVDITKTAIYQIFLYIIKASASNYPTISTPSIDKLPSWRWQVPKRRRKL